VGLGVFVPTGNNGWIVSATSPQYLPTFELNRSVVERAERFGFDFALNMVKFRGFGGPTKFWDYTLETFTVMSALAAVTERIKLFSSVGTLSLHPAMVARMASTIDSVAPGRFGINIVSGWNRSEYAQMGMWPGDDYYDYRYDYSSEFVAVMKELWEEGRSDFKGRFFDLDDCRLGPVPSQHIDIMAAGASARGRRFAAEYADYNFTVASGPDGLLEVNRALGAEAASTGRSVGTYVLKQVILGDTDEEARKKVDYYNDGTDTVALGAMLDEYAHDAKGTSSTMIRQRTTPRLLAVGGSGSSQPAVGSPVTIANELNALAAIEGTAGILISLDDYREGLDRFGETVVPLLDFVTSKTEKPSAIIEHRAFGRLA
jgi:pyrimidine oxygenase